MAALYDKVRQTSTFGSGGLASLFVPKGEYYVNITEKYPWTLNDNIRNTAPRVILKEYEINESTIKRQAQFYITAGGNFLGTSEDILSPYEELYQKDRPTGFVYDFPYFSEVNFEVNTPMWVSLDSLEQFSKATSSGAGIIGGEKLAGLTESVMTGLGNAAMLGLSLAYPKVGITDRPRLWDSHEPRSIEIKFPLFNTLEPNAWTKNRELCELLVNQNLYNKRDFITSIPPVFYEVLVIGQHYSYASCVTRLTINNKGNMRIMKDNEGKVANVPDVYEVNMTLTDMVMPSKNLFQSIQDPKVVSRLATRAQNAVNQETTTASTAQLNQAASTVGSISQRIQQAGGTR
jgi:hypothetical protein